MSHQSSKTSSYPTAVQEYVGKSVFVAQKYRACSVSRHKVALQAIATNLRRFRLLNALSMLPRLSNHFKGPLTDQVFYDDLPALFIGIDQSYSILTICYHWVEAELGYQWTYSDGSQTSRVCVRYAASQHNRCLKLTGLLNHYVPLIVQPLLSAVLLLCQLPPSRTLNA